ncbi:Holliday junction branch migration protein RuvA [Magnetospira sp. QH-2]|uniref:Holliday junction branch migration protein RuvA n=1 Tax=Magnetospira sp. (strain QH-2) TaxID=1288970 RepID=UPI0003E817DB|nr:Holliday junction branch migration protein RuvA [Magnetospira sp. QH-2]CCQ73311.1 Component of RuvABC resolvasome, regulatory subunit [Magnetospira sp. QH-2]
MIAKLKGLLDSTGDDWAIIDVNGVGYILFCSARTLARLPAAGGEVSLYVETHVREDHIHLYGFSSAGEREWFRLLLTVQGVGTKVALAILGILDADQLPQVIAAQDKAALTRAPGVGPKVASRLLSELKDKAGALALGAGASLSGAKTSVSPPVGNLSATHEAASALVNLGYGRTEALGAISRAAAELGDNADVAGLIRGGLAALAKDGGA